MREPEIFRAKNGYVLSATTVILSGLFIWSAALTQGLAGAIAGSCTANILVYLVFVRPRIIYTDVSIRIINPVEEIEVGWGDVDLVDAKWCMSITTKFGRFNAWAAPAPSRFHSKKIDSSELRGMEIRGRESFSPALSPKSDSGIAVHMAQVRVKDFAGGNQEFRYRKNWSWAALLGLSIAATLIVIFLGK